MADNIIFTDKEVAAGYECLVDVDMEVTKQKLYKGPLSGISLEMAQGMVARGNNMIKAKAEAGGTALEGATKTPEATTDSEVAEVLTPETPGGDSPAGATPAEETDNQKKVNSEGKAKLKAIK